MSRPLVLGLVVLFSVATAASGAGRRDRDHDGLPDRWERGHHLSTVKKSANGDPDRDGLRNRREYRLHTNPRRKDTDRDGLRDRAEVRRHHTNPRRKDTDGDGLRDRAEIRRYHTDPRKRDSDGDGYSDGAEVRAGTDPRDPDSHPSGSAPPPGAPPPSPSRTGFPDASNTGVPPGTTLTPSGSLTIGTAGAVIDRLDITGAVVVNAPNVTIRNSIVRGNEFILIRSNSTGLVVEDSEVINRPVSGQPNCHNGIAFSGFTVRRSEFTGCENAADVSEGNAVFEDNYVHDLDVVGPSWVFGDSLPHTDAVQMQGGGDNIVVRHNFLSPQASGTARSTSAIIMAHGSNPNDNTLIENNLIDGGHAGYAMYAPRVQSQGVRIVGNQMVRGRFGYTACVRPGTTVAEFSANRDVGTGAVINPDNGAGGSCSN